ncbi:MAG: sigma-70 family RNA polymerase sigma factor [Chloroflexota bacterium]|nr:sigma-70 family RNA polymerase sigma factor [Chloroflexota bacterium]
MERAKAYDTDALAQIFDQYQGKIYSYMYHRVGNPSVAQDLTSQVFLRVLEAIQNERAWQSSFSGWLYRIAHNLVIDYYRRRGRSTQVSFEDVPALVSKGVGPEQAAQRALDAEGLRDAINRLTEEQAQVVTLRFLEGLSIAEVAMAMEKTEGAIKALQYRAVSSLRRLMV